jgi:EAL domain-containing protein (putative c-di-GMP-specific phosphodiesterase class I)
MTPPPSAATTGWVLRRALADAAKWPDLSVVVNLSPLQIRDPALVARVGDVIVESGITTRA